MDESEKRFESDKWIQKTCTDLSSNATVLYNYCRK